MMDLIILIGIVVFLILLFLLKYLSQPATPQSQLTQNSQTVNGQQQNSNKSTNLPGSEETQTVRHRKNATTSPSGSNVILTQEYDVRVTSPPQIFVSGDRREELVGTDTTRIPETSSTSAACDGLRYRTFLSNRQPQPNPIRRVVDTPSSTLQPQPSTAVNQTNLFDSPLVTGTPLPSSSLNSLVNIHTRPTIFREEIVRISSSSSSTTQSSSTVPVPTGNSSVATRSQISASGNSTSGLPKDEKKYTIPPIVRDAPPRVVTRVNTIHTTTIHQRDEPLNVRGSSSTSPSSSAARVTSGNVTGATGGVSSESGPSKEQKKYKIPPIATGAPPRLRLVHAAPPPQALPARPTLPARPATPEPPAAEPAARTRLFDPYVEKSEPPEKKLDLRGFYLREAMDEFYGFFFHMKQVYQSGGRSEDDRYIYVVTGYGKFSENRRPKIKPAVQEFIDANEIRHNWLNEGLVMIDFCAEEDEISDSDDYDDDDEEEEEETNSDDYNGDVM